MQYSLAERRARLYSGYFGSISHKTGDALRFAATTGAIFGRQTEGAKTRANCPGRTRAVSASPRARNKKGFRKGNKESRYGMDVEDHTTRYEADGELQIGEIFNELLESITQGFTPEEKKEVSKQITGLFENRQQKKDR